MMFPNGNGFFQQDNALPPQNWFMNSLRNMFNVLICPPVWPEVITFRLWDGHAAYCINKAFMVLRRLWLAQPSISTECNRQAPRKGSSPSSLYLFLSVTGFNLRLFHVFCLLMGKPLQIYSTLTLLLVSELFTCVTSDCCTIWVEAYWPFFIFAVITPDWKHLYFCYAVSHTINVCSPPPCPKLKWGTSFEPLLKQCSALKYKLQLGTLWNIHARLLF